MMNMAVVALVCRTALPMSLRVSDAYDASSASKTGAVTVKLEHALD